MKRKCRKNHGVLMVLSRFFAEGPRETLVFSNKKKTSRLPAAPPFQSPGDGVGGGVNPSPKGKRGGGRGRDLNHSRPTGLVGFRGVVVGVDGAGRTSHQREWP